MADAKEGKQPDKQTSAKAEAENKPGLPPDAKDRNEVVERAKDSGIYTTSTADQAGGGSGGTGESGTTGGTGMRKLGDGTLKTEASHGTSADPQE